MKAPNTKIRRYVDSNDLRSIYDYDLKKGKLPERILREFREHVQEFLDEEKIKERIDNNRFQDEYFSPNKYFVYNGRNFEVCNVFYGGDNSRYTIHFFTKNLIRNTRSSIETMPYTNSRSIELNPEKISNARIHNSLRIEFEQMLVEDKFTNLVNMYGEPMHLNDYDYNSYSKAWIMSNEVSKALSNVLSGLDMVDYVHPNGYCRFQMSEDDDKMMTYSYNGRITKMKVGKCIKKMFKVFGHLIDDEQVKSATNVLTSNFDDYQMAVYEGSDITDRYCQDMHDNNFNLATLGSSCMKYSVCGLDGYFEIYEENAKLLVMEHKVTKKIVGRAILWDVMDLDYGVGAKVMDRVYGNEKVYLKFFEWAKANEYYRKEYQSYQDETMFIDWEDELEEKRFSIQCDFLSYGAYPYMDTFAWSDGDELRNSEGFGYYEARDTSGKLSQGGGEYDEYDEDEDEY